MITYDIIFTGKITKNT